MEPLIHESQHADENFERHEVEMLTPLLGENTIMACQSIKLMRFSLLIWFMTDRLIKYTGLSKF